MNDTILQRWLDPVLGAATEAGRAILGIAGQIGQVVDKEDGSPLTRADLASNTIITEALARLEPAVAILSEEGDLDAFAAGRHRTFWCVDPLDGTKEFVGGRDEYTVNIAVIEDARPVFGVVYIPPKRAMYWAVAGGGAWRRIGDGQAERIHATDRPVPRVVVASRSHMDDRTRAYLGRLGAVETIQCGSSAKMTAVAEGRADLYPRFGPTCLWDTAAGAAVALEAGCRVLALDGEPLSYDPARGLKREGFLVVPQGMTVPSTMMV
ncbi:MAG: 3'(2'),5'-bisphosphate nucleotidase CysQ [Planctomycetes bacterium]|nr:3'(2'),5'-bisphosphate nucleotidase CysQ [Planctomycetota bacterium]